MRAMLLAAGFGTRLRPLTDRVPKCLVPIKGKPLLEIWLERLTEAGVKRFLINTHHLADRVQAFIASSVYQDRITLVHESTLLGTAGTLTANIGFFENEDGLLIHADNYCLADFRAFFHAHEHRPAGCLMTMMTFRSADPSSCGIVELNELGVVTGFHEKVPSPPGNLANGAVYLLSAELLRRLDRSPHDTADFSTGILHRLLGQIHTYETTETFSDIGTPAAYATANAQ